jgi:hypothetical protein
VVSARDDAALLRAGTVRVLPLHLLIDTQDGRGVTWVRPGARLRDAAWRARHAPETLTPEDAMALAEAATDYEELVCKPAVVRDAVVARMREALDSEAPEESEDSP